MAASDHLSRALFHGTIENLREGQLITPRTRGGVAWASSDLGAVVEHTQDRTYTGLGHRGERYHPVHHGNIYEVEPVAQDPTLSEDSYSGTKGAIHSKVGFRVKRHVASVLGHPVHLEDLKYHPDFDPSKQTYVSQ